MRDRAKTAEAGGQGESDEEVEAALALCAPCDFPRGLRLATRMPQLNWRLDAGQIEVVDDAVAEVLRRKTPAERIAMAFGCRRLLCHVVRDLRPDWNDSQVALEVRRGTESGEYPLFLDDTLKFCIEKAGRTRAAQRAEELGVKEIWDAIRKRLSNSH